MRHVLVAVAVGGLLGVALLARPGAAPAANCGNLSGAPVKTKGDVSCRKARAIVKEFLKTREARIQGYRCKGSSEQVYCSLDRKQISWRH